MKKIAFICAIFMPNMLYAQSTFSVMQGDIMVIDLPTTCKKNYLFIDGVGNFPVVELKNQKKVIIATDIYKHPITSTIPSCGDFATSTLIVTAKPKDVRAFTIPNTQGGNSAQNAIRVKSQLNKDAEAFNQFVSNKKQLWTEPFVYPLKNPVVIDPFGYGRNSKGVTILHKGLDLKADTGTPIYAINKGIVAYIGNLPTYGKVVIIDHGKNIVSAYLHMSKVYVKKGMAVERKDMIGTSGGTGFVVGPHLHISIRVNGASINPEQFLNLLGASTTKVK
jgi:murein DD-endopeptidase MepM/ murein hydrolase activator NlpD